MTRTGIEPYGTMVHEHDLAEGKGIHPDKAEEHWSNVYTELKLFYTELAEAISSTS